jgi:hypothetical protein
MYRCAGTSNYFAPHIDFPKKRHFTGVAGRAGEGEGNTKITKCTKHRSFLNVIPLHDGNAKEYTL